MVFKLQSGHDFVTDRQTTGKNNVSNPKVGRCNEPNLERKPVYAGLDEPDLEKTCLRRFG